MLQKIRDQYASERGLVRLILAHSESCLGRIKQFENIDFTRVNRLVFVCLGNICRSPFGEFIAKNQGIETAGFGLATTTGFPAFELGQITAKAFNIDMSSHLTTNFPDFDLLDSDLILVMEVRHARRLETLIGHSKAQIALLGHWAEPRRLHIHDPHTHDEIYFKNCYKIIESATNNLVKEYKQSSGVT